MIMCSKFHEFRLYSGNLQIEQYTKVWYKFYIINVVILTVRSKTRKRRGIYMKYQDNIRNHYFWDSSEMPNIHETKKMKHIAKQGIRQTLFRG